MGTRRRERKRLAGSPYRQAAPPYPAPETEGAVRPAALASAALGWEALGWAALTLWLLWAAFLFLLVVPAARAIHPYDWQLLYQGIVGTTLLSLPSCHMAYRRVVKRPPSRRWRMAWAASLALGVCCVGVCMTLWFLAGLLYFFGSIGPVR